MQYAHSSPPVSGNSQTTVSEPFPLPSTLAGLLLTAISDARSLDPKTYFPWCQQWHFATSKGVCQVCLAGSLIAGSLRNSPLFNAEPEMFSDDTDNKLRAVDAMRQGEWAEAFDCLYNKEPNADITALLQSLPYPDDIGFYCWQSFERHLASLEVALPTLGKIDKIAESLS